MPNLVLGYISFSGPIISRDLLSLRLCRVGLLNKRKYVLDVRHETHMHVNLQPHFSTSFFKEIMFAGTRAVWWYRR